MELEDSFLLGLGPGYLLRKSMSKQEYGTQQAYLGK